MSSEPPVEAGKVPGEELSGGGAAAQPEPIHIQADMLPPGIKEGKFRNVNPTLAVRAHLGAVNDIMNPETLHQEGMTFQEALDFLYDIWSKGIVKDGKK